MISNSLFECEPVSETGNYENLDQYYFLHSNHLILFGLSSKHDLFVKINAGILNPDKCTVSFTKKGKDRETQA